MKRSEKAGPNRTLWVGIVDGKIHFYTSDYYGGVLHADVFPTRAAAKKC